MRTRMTSGLSCEGYSRAPLLSYVCCVLKKAKSRDPKSSMQVLLRHKHLSTTSFGCWRLLLPQKKSHRVFHSRAPLVSYVRLRAHSSDAKAPMAVRLRHKHLWTTSFRFRRLLWPQKKLHRGFAKNPVSHRSRFFF